MDNLDSTEILAFSLSIILFLAHAHHIHSFDSPHQRNRIRRESLIHPRSGNTSWLTILHNGNDQSFISTTGLDRDSFRQLLQDFIFPFENQSVYGNDALPHPSHLSRRLISPEDALGMCLLYLSSTMKYSDLGIFFGVTESSISKYLNASLQILNQILPGFHDLPDEEFNIYAEAIRTKHKRLKRCVGFIDGLRLKTFRPKKGQRRMYNGWTKTHGIVNLMLVYVYTCDLLSLI
jgi:hypothetical protein